MVTTGAITVLSYMPAAFCEAAGGSVTSWCPLACPRRAADLEMSPGRRTEWRGPRDPS